MTKYSTPALLLSYAVGAAKLQFGMLTFCV